MTLRPNRYVWNLSHPYATASISLSMLAYRFPESALVAKTTQVCYLTPRSWSDAST